ncbi:MAG: hypothetical protein ABI675_05195 [Chitinophagaceae bacterium]
MKQSIPASVFIVSAFLVVYVLLISTNATRSIGWMIFVVSPLLLVWMVISVLRSKKFTGKDLEKGEEWGYADKRKEDLGMF